MQQEMLANIKAVIFDLDGTLVDSMWIWEAIDREYFKRHGLKVPDDLQQQISGMSFSETANYIKNRFDISDTIEEMKEAWNRMAEEKYEKEVRLKNGAMEFLQNLKMMGIKLGVATSNSKHLVEVSLHARGIRHLMDSVHTACEVEHGKPSPDIYLLVAKDLEVPPEECLVFEDIVEGIQAGKRAGMRTCAVDDAASRDSWEAKQREADYSILDYDDLLTPALD